MASRARKMPPFAATLLILIGLLPVVPESVMLFGKRVYQWQAPLLAFFRPGQWIQQLLQRWVGRRSTNSAKVQWRITATKASSESLSAHIARVLARVHVIDEQSVTRTDSVSNSPAIKSAHFEHARTRSTRSSSGAERHDVQLWFFTARKQWLDVIELTIRDEQQGRDSSGHPEAEEDECEEKQDDREVQTAVIDAVSFSSSVVPASTPLALLAGIACWFVAFDDFGQNQLHLQTLESFLEQYGLSVEEIIDQARAKKQA